MDKKEVCGVVKYLCLKMFTAELVKQALKATIGVHVVR